MAEPLPVAILIEDEPQIRRFVRTALEAEGWSVHEAETMRQGLTDARTRRPDLIILDLGLPDGDGVGFLHDFRAWSKVPVIVLSARVEEQDKIAALDAGADDYLTKPFGVGELLARVRAVLRRQEMGRLARTRDPERGGYRFDGWQLERRGRRLFDPNATPIALSKGEYALLLAFLEAPQRPLSREHLLQATRIHEDIFDRSIDVQVLRLRRKLEINPSAPRAIRTERGIGYVFALPVEPF